MYLYIPYEATICFLVYKSHTAILFYEETNCYLVRIYKFVPLSGRDVLFQVSSLKKHLHQLPIYFKNHPIIIKILFCSPSPPIYL